MSREGVTENQLTRGEPSAELNNVVFEVASTAKVRLEVRVLEIIQAACGRASCHTSCQLSTGEHHPLWS